MALIAADQLRWQGFQVVAAGPAGRTDYRNTQMVGITVGGGLIGAIVALIIAAVVLLLSDRILSGLEVDGFGGAILAAIAIALVTWLLAFLLGILGMAVA